MPTYRLARWQDIKDGFSDTLLLGNGASIALDSRFQYSTLLEKAERLHLITPEVREIFLQFDTSDFEQVLNFLLTTKTVNRIFHIRDRKTEPAYRLIRKTLISIVQAVHPAENEIAHHFLAIADFIRHFSRIVSFNYDLFLYWSILWANEDRPSVKFKDCFPMGQFDFRWERFTEPIGDEEKSIPIFYPHGNLALVTDIDGNERKVISGDTGAFLLDRIIQEWEQGAEIPLFVSEGTSTQKLRAILKSSYLTTVYDSVLTTSGPTIVLYGLSLQHNDAHILNALFKAPISKIAVSIHRPSTPNWGAACAVIEARIQSFARDHHRHVSIDFFDSESQGAWIH